MTTDGRHSPRAIKGDAANDGYRLTTSGGVAMWLPDHVPAGGTTDQVLAKVSGDDFDLAWVDPPSGGGGGSGVDFRDRRWVPGSGELVIDEHRDSSIAAAWTRVDASGGSGRVTWSEHGDSLSYTQAGGDATGELHGLIQPLSGVGGSVATGDAFYTYTEIIDAANYTFAGLVLSDGTTYGAGNQLVATYHNSRELYCRVYTNWSNVVSSSAATTSSDYHCFLRIVYTGANVWRVDMSADGIGWRAGGTRTLAFTPTHVGYIASSFGSSGVKYGTYDTIRRQSGQS